MHLHTHTDTQRGTQERTFRVGIVAHLLGGRGRHDDGVVLPGLRHQGQKPGSIRQAGETHPLPSPSFPFLLLPSIPLPFFEFADTHHAPFLSIPSFLLLSSPPRCLTTEVLGARSHSRCMSRRPRQHAHFPCPPFPSHSFQFPLHSLTHTHHAPSFPFSLFPLFPLSSLFLPCRYVKVTKLVEAAGASIDVTPEQKAAKVALQEESGLSR